MEQQDLLGTNPNYQVQQNLPNATASLVLGIIAIIGAFCYGIIGLICGIIGLVLANKDRKLYRESPDLYLASSYSTSNAGRTCSIIGLVLAVLVIIAVILIFVLAISMSGGKGIFE